MRGPAEAAEVAWVGGGSKKRVIGMLTATEFGVRCAARSGASVLTTGPGAEAGTKDL